MREVDRLARDAKLSNKELAERLGVHSTMLIHLRAGRNLFSAPLLGRIAQAFPVPAVDDLIVHHLRVERAAYDAAKLALPSDDLLLERLHPEVRRDLRHFVRHFARESVETGRGLYLMAVEGGPLTLAVQFFATRLQEQRITVERIAANANPQPSEQRACTAAALLIVERIEYASAPVTDLIIRRSDVLKPVVLTSLTPVSDIKDRYLARICTSMLRPIALTPLLTASAHAE
jgi:transcriptional regulator with XRE-family HTH domain